MAGYPIGIPMSVAPEYLSDSKSRAWTHITVHDTLHHIMNHFFGMKVDMIAMSSHSFDYGSSVSSTMNRVFHRL
jgi:hypothetical protein